MKDPTASGESTDPQLVSAYAVYKGLVPGLKSYQDTSEGTSASKRRKAKRREKRKNAIAGNNNGEDLKIANGNGEISVQGELVGSSTLGKSSSNASKTTDVITSSKSQTKGKKQSTNASDAVEKKKKGDSSGIDVNEAVENENGDGDNTVSKKHKKKRKKNKKKTAETSVNAESGLESTIVVASDEEEEPPAKSRKVVQKEVLLPNPKFEAKAKKSAQNAAVEPSTPSTTFSGADTTIEKTPKKKKNKKKKSKKGKVVQQQNDNDTTVTVDESPSSTTPPLPLTVAKSSKQRNTQSTQLSLKNSDSTFVKDPSYKVVSKTPPPNVRDIINSKRIEDSVSHGKSTMEWLIHPVSCDEFMKDYWEKKPLLIKRKQDKAEDYYKWILTTQIFDDVLRRNVVKYTVNLDITSYTNGIRETLSDNMQGRVRPAVVWDYYNNGCSVRMLNPQSYIQPLWRVNASLQELLGSFVGANMYLTPPDSQGFAPHYDDIEAFILQIEGKKQWKVYAPRQEDESLPRFSSGNFSETDDNLGSPILDVILEEGDLLYFPRGFIHQAKTVDGEHSLHVTLSCHQLHTYGDLLKHHVNQALDKLIAKDVSFRQGLPTDYMSYMGIAHENTKDKELAMKRKKFSKKIGELVGKLATEPADYAADAMGKKFIWDSLPPFLTPKERETCVVEDGEFMQNGKVFNRVEFGPEVEVKLVRKNCVRLVVEEGLLKLYYSTENSMVYHEEEAQFLELSVEFAPVVNYLINQYPNYCKIEDLPIRSGDIGEKIQIISDLWERSLIFTKQPLEPCDLDDFESGDETANNGDDDDVESINLSDLPNEGESESESDDGDSEVGDDDFDEFYDTTVTSATYDMEDDSDDGSDLSGISDSASYDEDAGDSDLAADAGVEVMQTSDETDEEEDQEGFLDWEAEEGEEDDDFDEESEDDDEIDDHLFDQYGEDNEVDEEDDD